MVRFAAVLILALLALISRDFYSHLSLHYSAKCSHLPTSPHAYTPMTAMLRWCATSVPVQATTNWYVAGDFSANSIVGPPSAVCGRIAFAPSCASMRGAGRAQPPSERGRRSLDVQYLTGLLTRGERSIQKFHRTNTILQIGYAFLPM